MVGSIKIDSLFKEKSSTSITGQVAYLYFLYNPDNTSKAQSLMSSEIWCIQFYLLVKQPFLPDTYLQVPL